ncbi:MAG TPA: hypothetical protein VMX36_11630 [Sedimentisphaerales bacterium]|nr:hypothetical protein [Sedimentisphaerales bacterium]
MGLGQTYPLRDLAVRDEKLTVAFNTIAKIPIEDSQKGVLYQLHHKHELVKRTEGAEEESGVPVEASGNGETIYLETYKIQDDITFEILAKKQQSSREAYLHQTATVKVGLNAALRAWIPNVPCLDPTLESPPDTAPRIVDYNATVEVEIDNSQEGVDYKLVYFKEVENVFDPVEVELSKEKVRGNLSNITLLTQPISEDTDIWIRATKIFDPSENRAVQTTLLHTVLPLKVRANPALPVSVDPTPIIDYNNPATIKIAETQQSTNYQLYIRPIPDREFVHKVVPDIEVIKVSVEGEPDVKVRKPAREGVWITPEGYAEWGDAQQGTGGELELKVGPLTDDSLVIVQAQKYHQASPEPQTAQRVPSAVQLEQAAVVLVRPDPAPPLRVKVLVEGAQTSGDMQVFDGQPGIFYYFRQTPEGKEFEWPAYFHKSDDCDESLNKGLEQLELEIDFVVAADPFPGKVSDSANLAQVAPEPPLLQTGRLPTGTTLHIRAVKAQTSVATPLEHTANIPSCPEVDPEEAVVDYGAKTRIRIKASRAKEWYQLLLDGNPLGDPVKGTGQNRFLDTGELKENTTFELLIKEPDEPIVVERVLRIVVIVRPDTT